MDTEVATTLPAIIRSLLRQRGIIDSAAIHSFLYPSYDTDLADPFLMNGMNAAVERIMEAAKRGEKVAVYGDYDIDGITSTTVMLEVLKYLGLHPISYIPDRYDEGYGLHITALEELQKQAIDLVISVDCGITSVTEAQWARDHNLDLIITDHHDVPDELPRAIAVINPKQPGDDYPFKELAGVGIAFAVARAIQQRTGVPAKGFEKWLLDLVAMGTVCDVMPLVGENRVMVKFGLKVLQRTRRVGLVALAQSADIELSQIKAYHLGFVLGPRLNASGRLEHANYSLELITTTDPVEAQALAFQLEEMNHQRKLEQQRMTLEAEAQAYEFSADPVLVLHDSDWPHGVVGIVASKIAEKYEKPTLVLQVMGDTAKGSARSANGYNLIEGLRANEALFERLGGHHFAAGFTIKTQHIHKLRTLINDHYRSVQSKLPPKSQREADIEVEKSGDISWDIYNSFDLLEPFGNENREPVFGFERMKIMSVQEVGKSGSHLKLKLSADDGTVFEGIGFKLARTNPDLKVGQFVNIHCYLQKNEFNGRSKLQLNIISLQ